MGYEFDWYILKSFNNKAIHPMLNKYSDNLTDENKGLIMQILNKLEANIWILYLLILITLIY